MTFTTALYSEGARAEVKYPPELWATMSPAEMYVALQKEVNEVFDALMKGDINGEHGAKTESVQVAVVARRIYEEMQRRAG